jgi:hypothetical protein
MTTAKQNAIKLANVPGIVINDDNMGDYGLTVFQQQDITLAHGNGFKIVGERVPNSNTGSSWSILFNMWQAFSPRPDSFINISEPDSYWINQFRLLYGPMIEPIKKVYLPIIIR